MRRALLNDIFVSIADRGRALLGLPDDADPVDLAGSLCAKLVSERGEASGTALAREIVARYERMDEAGRLRFLAILATRYAPDPDAIRAAAEAYGRTSDFADYMALSRAVEPPRQELLRRINMAPGGTAAIVKMREHLLQALPTHPHLEPVEADLRHLLGSWFNRGFLQIECIDWHTPAAILEKLIAYEAVHAIRGWDDLRRRLARDRRCFAFFHPALPDEPLIFVEVALVRGMSAAITPLIESPSALIDEPAADTAIFYSISNCQPGLRGISFGNFLIKQVVSDLSREFPKLMTFATLSPIPGFRAWVERRFGEGAPDMLAASDREKLREATGRPASKGLVKALLADSSWIRHPALNAALQGPLMRLCAEYLIDVRGKEGPADSVARFHLGNGARIERLNWLADVSAKGLHQSYGLMVNYLYDPADIEANHEAFVREGRVAVSPAAARLRTKPTKLRGRALRLIGRETLVA
ncbi:MAG: malonyl-CoA decarboxylase [Rhodospirillales bacterium]|nr:malonyl-CoA decarboxylase [Rhodospirillales bacterium]